MQQLSSPSTLIKNSITLFFKKENLIYLSKIYALLLPFSLFSLFQGYFVDPQTLAPKNIWFTTIIVLVNILYVFVYVLVAAAGIEGVRRVVNNEKLDLKSTLAVAVKKYWKFLFLSVLLFFIVVFGFILLIVPGVIFTVWFSFSSFILITENKIDIRSSLSKSKALVKGRFWPVFWRVVVFGLFSTIIGMIVSLVPYGGPILTTIFGALFVLPSYLLYQELARE